jgi:hypothetical protein
VKSVRPNIAGGLSISSEVLDLSYPVCPQHAKGLALANQITRNTGGVKILRGLIYFIGGVGLFSFATSSLSLVLGALSSAQKRPSDVPFTFLALNAVFAIALVWTILAFNKVPVRVTGQSADVIRLKFKSDRYAREFAKLNRGVLR